MADYVIHRRVTLASHHVPTGNTRHTQAILTADGFIRGPELPPPHELLIAQLPPDEGYYLLYLDDQGEEITDTYHDSVDKALAQAKWEFDVDPEEWEDG
jgi:hypothetical protein